MIFKPLILAGGKSTRMGSPKHLLKMPDGKAIYQHQIQLLRQACPQAPIVYISLAKDSNMDDLLQNAAKHVQTDVQIVYDMDENNTAESAGPAAGLLAAHRTDPEATWLVIACDFPFLTLEALQLLKQEYTSPVTCFRNDEGFTEPLIGIWGPAALARLEENVANGRRGPCSAIRALKGREIDLAQGLGHVMYSFNTEEEWIVASSKLQSRCSQS